MSQTFGTTSSDAFNEEMRFLIEDVNVLLDYLGRFSPHRLPEALAGKGSAEFVQAGKRLAELIAEDTSAGTSTAREDERTNHGKAACRFLSQFALIAEYWSGKVGQSQFEGSDARNGPDDWAWLQSARAALVELVSPATLDSILVTRAMLDAIPEDAARPGLFRRFIQAIETALGAGPAPPQKKASEVGIGSGRVQRQVLSGRRLATHVRRVRGWTVILTVIVVSLSLFVGAGKTLVDERARQDALLRDVYADIDRDIAIQAARAPANRSQASTGAEPGNAAQFGERMHDTTLEYCQQPFRDHHGLVRYATAAQPINCARLWGVNRAVNQTTREMAAWMALVFPVREERHLGDAIYAFFARVFSSATNPPTGGTRRGGFPEGP